MAITTADIKNGLTIEFNEQLFQIVSFQIGRASCWERV